MEIHLSFGRLFFDVIMTDMFEKREISLANPTTLGRNPVSLNGMNLKYTTSLYHKF